jgi:hypothetical protein
MRKRSTSKALSRENCPPAERQFEESVMEGSF